MGEPLGTLTFLSPLGVVPDASHTHLTMSYPTFQAQCPSLYWRLPCLSATLTSLPTSSPPGSGRFLDTTLGPLPPPRPKLASASSSKTNPSLGPVLGAPLTPSQAVVILMPPCVSSCSAPSLCTDGAGPLRWSLHSSCEPLQSLSHSSNMCARRTGPSPALPTRNPSEAFHCAQDETLSSCLCLQTLRPQARRVVGRHGLSPLPGVNLALLLPACVAFTMSLKPFVPQFPALYWTHLTGWS